MERTKYSGKFIKVTEELIAGQTWERVYLNDGVIVYPIDKNGKIIMIEESRPHEIKPIRLKFVTGLKDIPTEDPITTANREMQEEIGYKGSHLEVILHRQASGTVNNHLDLILATGLSHSKLPNPDGEGTILAIKAFTIKEIKSMLDSGELAWSFAILGVFKIESMLDRGLIKF